MTEQKTRVLVAASGSGGHLYPARLIIEALLEEGAEVCFVGSGRPLEETIIAPTGVPCHAITTSGIKNLGVRGLIHFLWTLPKGMLETWRLLSATHADVIIGVGGYATFLPVTLAFLRRIPQWIHEAERNPGLANQVLSYYATRVSLAFPDANMSRFAHTIFTGHPVRRELRAVAEASDAAEKGRKHLLVLGGSQGARALDEAVTALAPFLRERGMIVWHQCRPENEAMVTEAYASAGIEARVMPFIEKLHEAYDWADVIISRSGAGAVMEIGVVNVPTIFVPFPYAQGDHQTANANILVHQGKAVLVGEGENFVQRLQEALRRLMTDEVYEEMRKSPCEFRALDAAQTIARGAISLKK